MSRVAIRLTRLEATVLKPSSQPVYDLSRLSDQQLERMAEIRARVDEVGLEGLTDAEVEEAATLTELIRVIHRPTEKQG